MPKRILQGVVVSDSSNKTIVVAVERRFTDPVMKKTVRKDKRYHAHDPQNKAKLGDKVRIRECRPLSRLKSWELLPEVPLVGTPAKSEMATSPKEQEAES